MSLLSAFLKKYKTHQLAADALGVSRQHITYCNNIEDEIKKNEYGLSFFLKTGEEFAESTTFEGGTLTISYKKI